MTLPPIELQFGDCQDLERFLAERIHEFNSKATGYFDGESFGATQRDESGTVVGGISGFTWGRCCFVSYLWVAEVHRGKGLGGALLKAFEKNAMDKNCIIALLSSHSFQSPGFYAHMGYEELARINDYPIGYSDLFFAKRLAPKCRLTVRMDFLGGRANADVIGIEFLAVAPALQAPAAQVRANAIQARRSRYASSALWREAARSTIGGG